MLLATALVSTGCKDKGNEVSKGDRVVDYKDEVSETPCTWPQTYKYDVEFNNGVLDIQVGYNEDELDNWLGDDTHRYCNFKNPKYYFDGVVILKEIARTDTGYEKVEDGYFDYRYIKNFTPEYCMYSSNYHCVFDLSADRFKNDEGIFRIDISNGYGYDLLRCSYKYQIDEKGNFNYEYIERSYYGTGDYDVQKDIVDVFKLEREKCDTEEPPYTRWGESYITYDEATSSTNMLDFSYGYETNFKLERGLFVDDEQIKEQVKEQYKDKLLHWYNFEEEITLMKELIKGKKIKEAVMSWYNKEEEAALIKVNECELTEDNHYETVNEGFTYSNYIKDYTYEDYRKDASKSVSIDIDKNSLKKTEGYLVASIITLKSVAGGDDFEKIAAGERAIWSYYYKQISSCVLKYEVQGDDVRYEVVDEERYYTDEDVDVMTKELENHIVNGE